MESLSVTYSQQKKHPGETSEVFKRSRPIIIFEEADPAERDQ
jgi:hypothetical protein